MKQASFWSDAAAPSPDWPMRVGTEGWWVGEATWVSLLLQFCPCHTYQPSNLCVCRDAALAQDNDGMGEDNFRIGQG